MYRVRFIYILFYALTAKPRHLLADFNLNFFAVPFIDTDVSRLFTHAYSSFMALGRWHFLFGSEFRSAAVRKKWVPVTTAETIEYKKSIRAFAKIHLKTKLLCWDEERFYLEQTFYVNQQLHAHAYLEGLVRSPNGHLKPTEVFQALGVAQESPPVPEKLMEWKRSFSKA